MNTSTPQMPHYGNVVQPYLKNGERDYLAQVLQHWSPAIDPSHHIGEALHEAILRNDETAVRMILDAGGDPKVQQNGDPGFTPLLAASQYGRLEIASLFWRLVGPDGRFYPSNRPNLSCLQVAARNGHVELVAYFLDVWNGWTDDEKRRAVYDAASSWCDDVVALLLAKVDCPPDIVQGALEEVVRRKLILPEDPMKPPPRAEEYVYQQRVVHRLIDAGANPDTTNGRPPKQPLLHTACLSVGCIGAIRGLLEKGGNANAKDARGRSALQCLVSRPPISTDAVRILLQHGALIEMIGEAGETLLHRVAQTGTVEQLNLFVSYSDDPDTAIRSVTLHGESLLHYAAAGGREDVVDFLLTRGLDVSSATSNGWTPLLCALSPTNAKRQQILYRLANTLLQRGANAYVVMAEGWTPLHALATWPTPFSARDQEARKAAAPLVQGLISRGAPVDTESIVIQSPSLTPNKLRDIWGFRMQKFVEDLTIPIQDLEGMSADTTPLMWAMRSNAIDIFEIIRAHLDSNRGDRGN
ncbi:Putative ankyrin repeat-containing domain superfamily [Colletotrichum destructivum]|uniref:Ankyrin repeat-containing domain superfamily n=1 Tax=Colletotrichum destructivum TaxID=34406 RepID=A0AAX4J429_9PEZI|nr:Putative ankyrin repeat-containing domain superfamily [Colletotrichum destructivum]